MVLSYAEADGHWLAELDHETAGNGASEDLRTNVGSLARWRGGGARFWNGCCEPGGPRSGGGVMLVEGAVPDMVLKAAIGLMVSGLLYQDHVEKKQMKWEIYSVRLWKIQSALDVY